MTRRFTPAGFALGPSYSGLGEDLRGLIRSPPQSQPIAGSRGERQYRAIIATEVGDSAPYQHGWSWVHTPVQNESWRAIASNRETNDQA